MYADEIGNICGTFLSCIVEYVCNVMCTKSDIVWTCEFVCVRLV